MCCHSKFLSSGSVHKACLPSWPQLKNGPGLDARTLAGALSLLAQLGPYLVIEQGGCVLRMLHLPVAAPLHVKIGGCTLTVPQP